MEKRNRDCMILVWLLRCKRDRDPARIDSAPLVLELYDFRRRVRADKFCT